MFFKNSKRTGLRKIQTYKNWPKMLILEHLVAVSSCGLQAKKKSNFQVSTAKSQKNQIWIFLFDGFNVVHSPSKPHPHFKILGLEYWPLSARKVPILSNLFKKIQAFLDRDQ
jgi:hypothetical protein